MCYYEEKQYADMPLQNGIELSKDHCFLEVCPLYYRYFLDGDRLENSIID